MSTPRVGPGRGHPRAGPTRGSPRSTGRIGRILDNPKGYQRGRKRPEATAPSVAPIGTGNPRHTRCPSHPRQLRHPAPSPGGRAASRTRPPVLADGGLPWYHGVALGRKTRSRKYGAGIFTTNRALARVVCPSRHGPGGGSATASRSGGMVDATVSKTVGSNPVPVRLRPSAPPASVWALSGQRVDQS